MSLPPHLILYSKSGCHLCEGLAAKLAQLPLKQLEVRDITTEPEWFQRYQYEIPVLCWLDAEGREQPIARVSPRASVAQVQAHLEACWSE